MTADSQDGTYEACLSYLDAKGFVLWGDYSLNPLTNDDGTPKNRPAARWLEIQVRGVADAFDALNYPYHVDLPRTLTDEVPYAGPYSTERNGGGHAPRPSALVTHGQQAERW